MKPAPVLNCKPCLFGEGLPLFAALVTAAAMPYNSGGTKGERGQPRYKERKSDGLIALDTR